ncbi:MAG: ABC transporter ATP-binding protein [Sphingobacteriaceae bacterium]|nr:ABC transporter ATP-binding protein [Sphingobacteriaceae bacterium]
MSDIAIKIEGLGKMYRLGEVGSGSFGNDIKRWWASLQSKEDPLSIIAEKNDRTLISKSQSIWALNDINFEVKKGEVLGILGKNGAGKSTLLKIISRTTAPTRGTYKIKGRIASLLEVGTGFHPDLSGRDNVFLNGAILGMTKKEVAKKFDEIVEFSGVGGYIDTPVKRYSSGMYVRLAFAVAAHLESDILIVDEVLAVGDMEFQKKCLGKMKDVSGQGKTVLFVSHNVSVIKNLCTSGIYLENGLLKSKGNLDKAIELYFGEKTYSTYGKTWLKEERPGNLKIKINKVSIQDSKNTTPSIVNISSSYKLVIEYETISDNVLPIFSFGLFYSNGELIFGSISNVEPKYPIIRNKSGYYNIECEIPPHTFNNGKYYITINGYCENYGQHFCIDSPISFEAFDDGILANDYKGNFGGYLRPLLNWKSSNINNYE